MNAPPVLAPGGAEPQAEAQTGTSPSVEKGAQASRWTAARSGAARCRAALRRWLRGPDTLFGRLACLLAVVVIASHVLMLTLMFELRPQLSPPPALLQPSASASGETLNPITITADRGAAERPYVVRRVLPVPLQPVEEAEAPSERASRPLLPFLLDAFFRVAALLVAAWFGARWLAKPMRRLAAAAGELGRNINRPPLPETGTVECREASRVFNQMQDRIRQQLQDRDRLVAAVSHDLRTPLTRLRLRAELLDDAKAGREFQRDIAEMDAMIQDTLDYLRGQAQGSPMVRVQVRALLQSVVDDHALAGVDIPLHGMSRPIQAQTGPLRRCVDNLIGNALRYGGGAEVLLEDGPQGIRITVRDHGPGLPETALQQVMQPFVRMEASRHRHHGGVGLGLSIARDIALRHHGQLTLHNAEGGGLCAVLELPHQQP